MHIVADENIPLLDAFFGDLGRLTRLPGRALTPAQLRDADLLLVRSVTPVTADLLATAPVRFVGTATIGTDHVDTAWLQQQGITFASAPGCNAVSVVEYVLAVLSLYGGQRGLADWRGLSVGIVGAGNVGGRLAQRLRAIGVTAKCCDPPRATQTGEAGFVSLEEALACDVISLHTPLTVTGPHATHHMLGEAELAALGNHQLLINSGRGAVVDNRALSARLRQPDAPWVALDVWEQEPAIDSELLGQVWLGTPHIAGYSLEGKSRGTAMLYEAVCRWLGRTPDRELADLLPSPWFAQLQLAPEAPLQPCIDRAIRLCYDPRDDHQRLLATLGLRPAERAAAFDALRRNYPVRREFASLTLAVAADPAWAALGFNTSSVAP
ncbi:MAG: 4-phosphoerythronate dehydrogenase [Marinobacter sp.]|nr:4-phosphoerythronate dehydrogenase [Marinobacter sp.]